MAAWSSSCERPADTSGRKSSVNSRRGCRRPIDTFGCSACAEFVTRNASVLSGSGGGGQGQECVAAGAPASSGPFEVGLGDDSRVVAVTGVRVLAALPVAPGGAQCAHGGGVAAAFGGEVAAVAEHVRPAAEGPVVLVGMGADLEAGADEASLVGALVGVDPGVVGGDPAGEHAGGLGGLGGVFGQVGGDGDVGDFAVVGEADDARIDLGAPGDVPAAGLGWVRDCREPDGRGDLADEVGEQAAVIAGCGWVVRSGWMGSMPSSRKMAWKWMRPRRWYSATLA